MNLSSVYKNQTVYLVAYKSGDNEIEIAEQFNALEHAINWSEDNINNESYDKELFIFTVTVPKKPIGKVSPSVVFKPL